MTGQATNKEIEHALRYAQTNLNWAIAHLVFKFEFVGSMFLGGSVVCHCCLCLKTYKSRQMQKKTTKDVAVQTDLGEVTEKLAQNDDGLNDTYVDEGDDHDLAKFEKS
jgi:hypothetical protein